MARALEAAAGAIYDIGYRNYEGARLGRGYAFRTLYVHSLRTAFGLGRGGRVAHRPLGAVRRHAACPPSCTWS